ncbi:MAG: ABC transporter permease [Actinobacteria bacterium]|nr:ABC transporter permease [Actinomycetota bacterium]
MSRVIPATGSETLHGQDTTEGDVSRRPDDASAPAPGPAVLLIPTPALAPPEPRTRRGRRRALGLVVPVALVALWALAGAAGFISPRLLPPPAAVAEAGWDFVAGESTATLPGVVPFDGAAARHVSASVARWLSGFALGVGVGVPLGLALGLSRRAGELLDPLVQALRSIPITAWLPITLVWFGLSEGAARYLVFIGALFPIVIATADSAARVPRALVDTALMLGTSRSALARRVYVPAALPGIVTGLRLGLTLGWMSVIVAELTGQTSGVGAMMFAAREIGRLDHIIVGMATFAVIGLAGDVVLRAVSRRFVAWSEG